MKRVLDEVGGDPGLDALGLARQEGLAHLGDDAFLEAENDDVDRFLVQGIDEAAKALLAQIELGLDLKIFPRRGKETLLPVEAILRDAAEQNVLAQVRPAAALPQPVKEQGGPKGKHGRAAEEKEPQRGAADGDLRDVDDDNAAENGHEHQQERAHDAPQRPNPRHGRIGLVNAHVLQGERTHRHGQGDHPIAILELGVGGLVIEPDEADEDESAQGVRNPDRAADEEGVDHLKDLLIKSMLTG